VSAQEVKAGEAYIALKTRDTGVAAQTRQAAAKVDEELNRSLARSRETIAKRMKSDSRSVNGKQQLLLQGAFAVEDAASQYQNMGAMGAVRAASNNVSAMLMTLGSTKLMLGGIASIAAVQLAPVLIDAFTQSTAKARETEGAIKAIGERMQSIRTMTGIRIENEQELQRIAEMTNSGEAAGAGQSKQQQLDTLRAQMADDDVEKAFNQARLGEEFDKVANRGAWGNFFTDQYDSSFMERQKSITGELSRLERKRTDDLARAAALQEQIAKAKEREAELLKQEQRHIETGREIQIDAQRKTMDQQTQADLQDYDKIESAEAARNELQRLEREQQQLDIDYERQGREADEFKKRKAEASPEAQARWDVDHAGEITRMAMERDRTNIAYDNNLAKQAHLRGRFGELQKRAGIASLDSMLGQTNTPTGNRIRIQDETDRQQREIAKLPLPAATIQKMQSFSQLTGQRRLADVALQEFALKNTPTVPQAALMRGSVEATQAAAGNSLAATTTKMAKDIESMEGEIATMATDLREFLDQHTTP